jgi:energy-converting hydrogenase Eha subunit C
MINKDRIVPIQKMDLLTMIGTILALHGTSYAVLAASTIEGAFSVTGSGAAGNKLANQPVQSLDFASGVTGGTVYFVPAFDYKGVTVAGAAATMASGSATVNPDGVTVYKAVLSSGEVTITAVSPVIA